MIAEHKRTMITELSKKPSQKLKNTSLKWLLSLTRACANTQTTAIADLSKTESFSMMNRWRLLAQTAVSQAKAGADIIAPSNMMDGFVTVIREALDKEGFVNIPIMSYAVKYSSEFYGPFRDAANSTPQFGDRKTYQMDPANRMEALREAQSDVEEGADFLIVKPSLSYMDIMRDVKNEFTLPLVAYNVSGEYSMVKAAAQNGWIKEKEIVLEILTSMKRAGADLIITYHAKDAAKWLAE